MLRVTVRNASLFRESCKNECRILSCGYSSKEDFSKETKKLNERDPRENVLGIVSPQEAKCDCIGPPDRHSNLRSVRYYIPHNETSLEKHYRESRQETQEWNQKFWASHNAKFKKMKEEFIQLRLKEKYGTQATERRTLSADEMSVFYKQFLEDHKTIHKEYNREWYKKNVNNVILAARVFLQQKGRVR